MSNNYKNIRLSNIYKYIFVLTFTLVISLIINSFYTCNIANALSKKDQEDFKTAEKCKKYHNVIRSKVSSGTPYQIIGGDIPAELKTCVKQGMCAWAKADCDIEVCPPAKKAWNNMTTKEQYDDDAGKDKGRPILLQNTKVPKSVCKKAVDTYSRLNPIINNNKKDQAKICVKWDGQTYVESVMRKCNDPDFCTVKKDHHLDCSKAKALLNNGGTPDGGSGGGGSSGGSSGGGASGGGSSSSGDSSGGSSSGGSSSGGVNSQAQDDQKCRKGALTFGWIVCPGTDAMSRAADGIAAMIANALNWSILANTKPVDGLKDQPQNVILEVWQNMLSIGNIILAIAFLVMLYSYALNSSNSLRAYDAKKLLSRLLIVAIAMNLSFYICAAIADISNMAGRGVYELINSQLTSRSTGWYSAALNSAKAIAAGIGTLMTSYLNANIIVVAILIMLAALALRQVALIVLVIMSPIAFACYLLPNTEKWFKKWWDAYVRLLIVFPFFTAAWAGCRLVGYIVSEADMPGVNDLAKGVIAVLATVAPPVLLIPIFKMSGGLAGRVAGLGQMAADKTGATKFAKERDAARRKRRANDLKRASIKVQNKLSGSNNKFARLAGGAIGHINGTKAAAANQRSQESTDDAFNGAVDNINEAYTKKKFNKAKDKLKDTSDAEVVNMAKTGTDAKGNQLDEFQQAAAIETAQNRGVFNADDAEDVMLAAQKSGSKFVRNTAAESQYGKSWLMDQQAKDNFVNQENEWKNIDNKADVQGAIDKSLQNSTKNSNAAVQRWNDMSVGDRTRITDRALSRGNVALVDNLDTINKKALQNQTILNSDPTDVNQFNHQINSINAARAGNKYDVSDGGKY